VPRPAGGQSSTAPPAKVFPLPSSIRASPPMPVFSFCTAELYGALAAAIRPPSRAIFSSSPVPFQGPLFLPRQCGGGLALPDAPFLFFYWFRKPPCKISLASASAVQGASGLAPLPFFFSAFPRQVFLSRRPDRTNQKFPSRLAVVKALPSFFSLFFFRCILRIG